MSVDIQMIKDAIHRLKQEKVIKLQKDIARDTGYEEATVSEILNEKQVLSDKFVRSFILAYNLDPENLRRMNSEDEAQNKKDIFIKRLEEKNDEKNTIVLMYNALIAQMDKTNQISLLLAESIKSRDKEDVIKNEVISKNADTISRLSEVVREIAGEQKLKKALGKVS